MRRSIDRLGTIVGLAIGAFALAHGAVAQPVPTDFSDLIESRLDGAVTVTASPPGGTGGESGQGAPAPSGTGFFINRDGVAIAPAGIVGDAESVAVTLADGTTLDGTVAATDEETGIAIVETRGGRRLPVLPWETSEDLSLGDWLVVLGRPQPETPTAAVGIVGALPQGAISSDMPIGPANLGGPVLNDRGRVVGVAALMPGPSDAPRGVILTAERVRQAVRALAEQTAAGDAPTRLGVAIQEVDSGLANAFGVEPGTGALVAAVEQGSAAAAAGIQPGDVITGFAGQEVKGPQHLQRLVREASPGDELSLTVNREGRQKSLSVALPEAAAAPAQEAKKSARDDAGESTPPVRLGMRLLAINPAVAEELGVEQVDSGVLVMAVEKEAPADAAGLRPGDIIVGVGKKPVGTPGEIVSALRAAGEAGNETVALRVYRDGSYQFISVPV